MLLKDSRPALKSEAAYLLNINSENNLHDSRRAHTFETQVTKKNFGAYVTHHW